MFAAQILNRHFSRLLVKRPYIRTFSAGPVVSRAAEHDESRLTPKYLNQLERVHRKRENVSLPILDSETPSPTLPTRVTDEFSKEIQCVRSLDELLNLVVSEESIIEEQHIMAIFRQIQIFQASPEHKFSIEHLQNHPGFVALCKKLRNMAPTLFDTRIMIGCLKGLVVTDVASESRVAQSVLGAIKNRVNDLSLQQIIYLDQILRKMDCPLAKALQIALPIVFDTHLEEQLRTDHIPNMVLALEYAVNSRLPEQKIRYIISKLSQSQSNTWTSNQVCIILTSLSKIENQDKPDLLLLLDLALERLPRIVNNATSRDLDRMIIILGQNFKFQKPYWFKESVCRAIAERIVREHWPLYTTTNAARTFAKMAYVHFEFLDHFSRVIVEADPSKFTQFAHSVSCFAVPNYRPKNFAALKNIFEAIPVEKMDNRSCFRFILGCAVLGIYPKTVIQHVLSETWLNQYFNDEFRSSLLDWLQLNAIVRTIKIEDPDYDGPWPDSAIIQRAQKETLMANLASNFPLHDAFHEALRQLSLQKDELKGATYLVNGLLTKYGHYIDHLIILDTKGDPVPFTNNFDNSFKDVRYVEDFQIPSNCRRLLVKVFTKKLNCYVSNGDKLRGMHEMDLRTLEKAGYDVLHIHQDQWESMLDYEKIPFLMRALRLKIKSD